MISHKQVLADQVLDGLYDVSQFKDSTVKKAISKALRDLERGGGPMVAPAPLKSQKRPVIAIRWHAIEICRANVLPNRSKSLV